MLTYPAQLSYTKTHEYVRLEGNIGTIGITAFAADQLGDVTFVELPAVGQSFNIEEKFGVIESVKSVSDLFMPISGEVIAINERLASEPELVNNDCYGEGWMIKVKVKSEAELKQNLTAEAYKEFVVD